MKLASEDQELIEERYLAVAQRLGWKAIAGTPDTIRDPSPGAAPDLGSTLTDRSSGGAGMAASVSTMCNGAALDVKTLHGCAMSGNMDGLKAILDTELDQHHLCFTLHRT